MEALEKMMPAGLDGLPGEMPGGRKRGKRK
jgi:hypothetical protein